jgi:hemerythrin
MAIVKVIEINANTSKAKKDLESLNETLDEQRQILIELEKELVKTEQLQATTSKTNLAAQKQLTKQANHFKRCYKRPKTWF